jgi:hypothetical protein
MDNSNDILKELEYKQKVIQNISNKRNKLEGQREQILSDLKKKFNLNSLEEAKVELESIKVSLDSEEQKAKSLLVIMDEIISKANRV